MLNESAEEDEQGAGVEEGGQPAHEAGHLTIAVTEADRNALQRVSCVYFFNFNSSLFSFRQWVFRVRFAQFINA